MPEMTKYAPGTPSWVDLGSPDVERSVEFYSALFGWDVAEGHPEAGGYRIAHLRGKTVAGLGPQQGPVSTWTTYFATDDLDAHVATIREHGGLILMEPFDVLDQGRMAIAADPEGAVFGLWEAGLHKGAQVVNEPGAMAWNELWTREREQAKPFYSAVLGYGVDDDTMPGYTVWQLGGKSVAGGMDVPPDVPTQMPAHWAVYFSVDDTDSAAARVTELGGRVVAPPFDVPGVGRVAIVHGPANESFGLFTG